MSQDKSFLEILRELSKNIGQMIKETEESEIEDIKDMFEDEVKTEDELMGKILKGLFENLDLDEFRELLSDPKEVNAEEFKEKIVSGLRRNYDYYLKERIKNEFS